LPLLGWRPRRRARSEEAIRFLPHPDERSINDDRQNVSEVVGISESGLGALLRRHDTYSVIETDISAGQNFFDFDTALAPVIVTNPPFRHIRPFIDHAFDIGVQQMVLVCGERLWACKKGREQFERHRPSSFANMDWREDYLGKGGKPDRALAVSIWTSPHADHCRYEVWSRP
jgi:hypothetical protein